MVTGYAPCGASESPRDLPDGLELPLASGAPYWYWIAGRPSLDFVNTRRERWRRNVETLVTPRDLEEWLAAAGLLAGRDGCADRRLLREAIELREAIDAAVTATIDGAPVPAGAVATIDAWLARAAARPRLVLGPDGNPRLGEWTNAKPLVAALGAIALDAAELLGRPSERSRLRICASDRCSARFYDRSRPGTRRWCSMRACGNVAKARRHRARTAPPTRPFTSEVPT